MTRYYHYRSKFKNLLKDIYEAVSGTEQDFTTGRLSRSILLLSVPMVLEMIMESIFAVVDIFFVSKLGPDAVATVGLTESLITIVYAIAFGLSTATTAVVSRRTGEHHPEQASSAAFQGIVTGIFISLLIAIPGIIFARDLLGLMGANGNMVSTMSGYTSVMLGGNMVIMLLFIINAAFRSSGDAVMAMRILWIANLVNIILDPILIFGWGPIPALGVKGAAIATTIGRATGVILQFYFLFKGSRRIRLVWSSIKIELGVIRNLIMLSLGGIGQNIIATSSWIGLMRIVSDFGSEVVAGYTIAIRIIIFSMLPSWGISNAAATLVGQNLGAGNPGRAEKSVWRTGLINIFLLGSIGIILVMFPAMFIKLFIDDPLVIEKGATSLRIISYGFISYGLGMVVVQAINGAGDTRTPTIINFFCFWMLEIPLAYLLAIMNGWEEQGVFWSIVIAESILTLSAVLVFSRGGWKKRIV